MSTFTLAFSSKATLDAEHIWPEGDAPDSPKAIDVARVLEEYACLTDVISEWNLGVSLTVCEVGEDGNIVDRVYVSDP